jgi:hypothetical protein
MTIYREGTKAGNERPSLFLNEAQAPKKNRSRRNVAPGLESNAEHSCINSNWVDFQELPRSTELQMTLYDPSIKSVNIIHKAMQR